MIENKKEWRDLLNSIDNWQRMFNEQLKGVKEQDIPQKLLNPMKRYVE